jgi:hypothetical protein
MPNGRAESNRFSKLWRRSLGSFTSGFEPAIGNEKHMPYGQSLSFAPCDCVKNVSLLLIQSIPHSCRPHSSGWASGMSACRLLHKTGRGFNRGKRAAVQAQVLILEL